MRADLPTGTVTFLFTDVEGSTRLLHELGAEAYAEALAAHRRVLRTCCAGHGGVEVDTQGDAFFFAFPTATGAVAAARDALAGLDAGPIRVRMGVHTGTPHVTDEGYVGVDVHRAARIAACGHGGQLLLSAAGAALVEGEELRDLGEHRLKDLSAPERIFQLGTHEFPPLRTLHRTNLPVPATPFVGREAEIGEVGALLAAPGVRLLTLVGPGGTGKTRLALQAAAVAADRFPAGVFWVPLAALSDPTLVLETAAAAVGATDGLAAHVGDGALLLVLDNFEHVAGAAEELPALLASCPNLRLLVTSRELLRLPAEQAYTVDPLAPRAGVELFLARARAVDPAFTGGPAVAELCARLDHLPLALELAAARVRVLTPQQLLDRLGGRLDLLRGGRGADPRQRTLRTTIEWSHDLLDESERALFARLAVFAGGWTLDAAESVCDADLDALESLVDKSLVRFRDGDRFSMLETIHEYARERLRETDEKEALGSRHAAYYLRLAEDAADVSALSRRALERLAAEIDNFRSAFATLRAAADAEGALRLSGAVAELFAVRGHVGEARRMLDEALALDTGATHARARALVRAADVATDSSTSRRRAEEAKAIYEALGHSEGIAEAVFQLGSAAADDDDAEAAREAFAASAELYRASGAARGALLAERMLAWMHARLGDAATAGALYEAVLREARELGDVHIEAHALEALAGLAVDAERPAEAAALVDDAYAIHRELDDRFRISIAVCRFARVLAAAGEPRVAARVLAAGERACAESGADFPWVRRMNAEIRAAIAAQADDAELAAAWELGATLTPEGAVAEARAALGLDDQRQTGAPAASRPKP